jgi:phosphoglycolate phosphatase
MEAPACLLFDLDGTLIDSIADLATAANVVRAEHGLPALSDAIVGTYVGDGARKLIERTFIDVPGLDVDAVLKRFRAVYLECCTERTTLYPGVAETLAALADLPMAIVSNKPQEMCDRIAPALGLTPVIDAVVGARRGVPVKPDPALLRLALDELGVIARDASVWMIGDSANDVRSGKAIGATTVGVTYGIGDVDAMKSAGPAVVLDGFGGLAGVARR